MIVAFLKIGIASMVVGMVMASGVSTVSAIDVTEAGSQDEK